MQEVTGFDWDDGNLEKCQKHGVTIHAIESAFYQSIAVFPDPVHSDCDDRFIGIGKTSEGRHVFIAFTLRNSGNMF